METNTQKRIRKIVAPQMMAIRKRSNLNTTKKVEIGKQPTNSLKEQPGPSEDSSAPAAESERKSIVIVKKAAGASNQKVNLGGGYTPTIIARNQIVPNSNAAPTLPLGNANDVQGAWPKGES